MLAVPSLLPVGKRTIIVGVLNVTPDSFFDGGRYLEPETALSRALQMIEEGADMIDVGGESARPGADPITAEEELKRVLPVVRRLAEVVTVPISVDTYKSEVAAAALEAGATWINDISGLHKDPKMASVVAAHGAGVIVMHSKGDPKSMQIDPRYDDLVGEVKAYLQRGCERALEAGVGPDRIWIDPGFGFGKRLRHNLELLRRLSEFRSLGFPILVGTSNKSMIGQALGLPVDERGEGTAATVAVSIVHGAAAVRVHDVKAMKRVAQMTDAILGRATSVYLSLGSNLGDRLQTLEGAIAAVHRLPGVEVKRISRVYETEPVGYTEQPPFLNVAVKVETTLSPHAFLKQCQEVEAAFGRTRDVRWGPRTLDIDVIYIEGERVESERLVVPHPEAHKRSFVIVPLLELGCDPVVREKRLSAWLRELDAEGGQSVVPTHQLDFMKLID